MEFKWVFLEVLVILLTHFTEGVLTFVGYKVSQSSFITSLNGPENAVDNDDATCAVTEYGVGNYWRIQFNQTFTVKSVDLRLKGGNYTIEVRNSTKEKSDQFLCASKHFAFPSSTYSVIVACKPAVHGDIIVVHGTDSGKLTLCDFKLKVCKLSSHDDLCPVCTSDSTCRHCDQSHYGVSCEHKCSPGCVHGSCNELNGECNCNKGFIGTHCQFTGYKPVLRTGVLTFVGYKVLQSSFTTSHNGPENAVDNNDITCAVTEYGVGNYWRIQFNQTLTVKSVDLRLKGGNYTIEVRNSSKENSDRLLCASLHLEFQFVTYSRNVTCKPASHGDIIVVHKTDIGYLHLCDFKLKACKRSSHDVLCPMCTSDSTCRHCDQSHYGALCEHNCSIGCVPGPCDELIGECNSTTGLNANGTHSPPLIKNQVDSSKVDGSKNIKIEFWVLCSLGFLTLITTPFLVKRFYKQFRCCKTIQAYFEPRTNLSEHDTERTRFSLSSSRVILEPEGDRRNSDDPYNQAIQVVVTFNSINAKPQPIEQFVKETHQKMMTNEFRSEFKVLPNGLMNLHTEALKRENITKNRFKKIYPYDANRVILMSSGGSYSGDYINASFIQGVYKEDAYIAAQGPFTEQTVVDFWRMVWQVKSRRIVMLTCLTEDGKEKCLQYWPDDIGEYGPFHVIIQKREVFDKFTIRKFIVRKGEETKRVNHYQFTVWPDTKVPESLEGLLCFRNLTKNSLRSDEGPMIVHGSAGIGRTGTFIALDYLLEKGFKEGSVDVKTCVISLRQQRPFAIQSVDQYAFLHDALVEGFTNLSWNCALHVLDEM